MPQANTNKAWTNHFYGKHHPNGFFLNKTRKQSDNHRPPVYADAAPQVSTTAVEDTWGAGEMGNPLGIWPSSWLSSSRQSDSQHALSIWTPAWHELRSICVSGAQKMEVMTVKNRTLTEGDFKSSL